MSPSPDSPQSVMVKLRLQATTLDLIDQAATALGKDRNEFIVDAARDESEAVLLDRCCFRLDTKAFAAFTAALDKPSADSLRLRRLLRPCR
jgi:uncharacterized protein (DUF1778 family)